MLAGDALKWKWFTEKIPSFVAKGKVREPPSTSHACDETLTLKYAVGYTQAACVCIRTKIVVDCVIPGFGFVKHLQLQFFSCENSETFCFRCVISVLQFCDRRARLLRRHPHRRCLIGESISLL